MTKLDISNYLAPYGQTGIFGNQSFAGQYRAANRQMGQLDNLYNTVADEGVLPEDYELFRSALKGQKGSAIAGGITAGLTGATTLLAGAQQAAHINDTAVQEGQIEDLSRAGNYNYNNYAQLANDYAQTGFDPAFNYRDIRGMTKGQQVGSVASSALTGATTGFEIGGPWGAAIGGVVGLGSGLWGVLSGNKKAQDRLDYLNASAQAAQDAAEQNFEAAHERIREDNNRRGAVNMVAQGGPIKTQSLKEYADRVLRRPVRPFDPAPAKMTRSHGDGGTIIRIRVK